MWGNATAMPIFLGHTLVEANFTAGSVIEEVFLNESWSPPGVWRRLVVVLQGNGHASYGSEQALIRHQNGTVLTQVYGTVTRCEPAGRISGGD